MGDVREEKRATRSVDALAGAPVAIEVLGVDKAFRIPQQRIDSLRERFSHPLRRQQFRILQALEGISFDVRKGEFFGIVGRNGSGKTTLLKIMASIYRPDEGRIRMAGRLAPFIELGVGFNPELTSRENIVLNGVLMGLSRREAARRLDAVLDFAELQEFADLELKNYSSGMMVRLAFAVMVEAHADIMLIDEVLAVGDASFAQKCLDVFREMRAAGRTIVLVTHDMATVQRFCHRAMLIHDAEIKYIGEPEEAALRYYRLNFRGDGIEAHHEGPLPDVNVRVLDVWLENGSGERVQNIEQKESLYFNYVIEARRDLDHPVFSVQFSDADGIEIFGFTKLLDVPDGMPDRLYAGQRVRISGEVENRLLPGTYYVSSWILRNRTAGDLALHNLRLLEFVVYGTGMGPGSVQLHDDVSVEVLDPETSA